MRIVDGSKDAAVQLIYYMISIEICSITYQKKVPFAGFDRIKEEPETKCDLSTELI